MLDLLDVAIGFATVMLAVSLIITSLTQAIVSLLGLRGRNLSLGLKQLIEATIPDLKGEAKRISEEILKHPLISDSAVGLGRWGSATTIKREELIPVLKAVLGEKQFAEHVDKNGAAILAWFDSFMARVSQWFVMHTRWITVGLALVLAFSLELDSGSVLHQIQTDSSTRAKLSGMAGVLIDQTPDVLARVEAIYLQALQRTVDDNLAKFTEKPGRDALPTTTRSSGATWIGGHVKDRSDLNTLVAAYNKAVDDALETSLERSVDRAQTIAGDLSSTGIILGPAAVRAGPNPFSPEFWTSRLYPISHLFGILVSVVFLSLGAPFWFNLLKNLTSLRPVVAQQVSPTAPAAGAPSGARALPSVAVVEIGPSSLPDLPVTSKA